MIASLIVLAMSAPSVGIASAEELTPRAPIIIDGNAGFTAANGVAAGSGTASDPYMIENWSISAENAKGIEIRNTTAYFVIENCHVRDGGDLHDGIYLENVRNGRIDGVKSEKNFVGINVRYSSNITIKNSVALNNLFGISVSDSSGNVIANCIASKNFWQGIFLGNSSNNVVANSKIEGNLIGVNSTNSENNRIYHNNFVNNEIQAYDNGANLWDDGYPSGGNYWSDYRGEDADNDGIGDTSYVVTGDNNQDLYPLMNPFEPPAQAPSGEGWWPLIAGIVGGIVIIGVSTAFYMRKMRLERVKKRVRGQICAGAEEGT
jgi:parallel beta-helix repeat protein